jgi:hypothetical protein
MSDFYFCEYCELFGTAYCSQSEKEVSPEDAPCDDFVIDPRKVVAETRRIARRNAQ